MLGLCSVTFSDKRVSEVVAIAKEAGLDGIEWSAKAHVKPGDWRLAFETLRECRAAGLTIPSYGTYYTVGSYEDFDVILQTAEILEASAIRVWAGEEGSVETSDEKRQAIVADAQRIAKLAAKNKQSIHFEYHRHSLTDTPESALQLMKEVDQPNVFLYWQPAESLTVVERVNSFRQLAPMVSTLHVFHWKDYNHRFPLEDGKTEWQQYIQIAQSQTPMPNYLFEFVKDNDPAQLITDVAAFKAWLIAESK
ncbi:sugar phosphate isomerase/epimerase family protein [Fundicoccus culcitae]|uniref:TIM barrel protein n=1 Tax=Fundicoccus culcitae TaxID=2969821 RepID=A0ABY5P9S4_9LACT|nr:TIM barrel protein [Fundicoccus culcitae]UUX35356.1 TIM barrel protein [Fundicoccus culcitae]